MKEGDVMKTEYQSIAGVPALVIGEEAEKVWLFVHGKMGCKEEAFSFAEPARMMPPLVVSCASRFLITTRSPSGFIVICFKPPQTGFALALLALAFSEC